MSSKATTIQLWRLQTSELVFSFQESYLNFVKKTKSCNEAFYDYICRGLLNFICSTIFWTHTVPARCGSGSSQLLNAAKKNAKRLNTANEILGSASQTRSIAGQKGRNFRKDFEDPALRRSFSFPEQQPRLRGKFIIRHAAFETNLNLPAAMILSDLIALETQFDPFCHLTCFGFACQFEDSRLVSRSRDSFDFFERWRKRDHPRISLLRVEEFAQYYY